MFVAVMEVVSIVDWCLTGEREFLHTLYLRQLISYKMGWRDESGGGDTYPNIPAGGSRGSCWERELNVHGNVEANRDRRWLPSAPGLLCPALSLATALLPEDRCCRRNNRKQKRKRLMSLKSKKDHTQTRYCLLFSCCTWAVLVVWLLKLETTDEMF